MSFPLHLPRARPLLFAIACAAACLVGLIATDQSRAAGWLPLTAATDGTSTVTAPRVAVDDAGNVYVAWIQNGTMEVSKRPVGGAFEAPQALDAGFTASSPDIGVDGAGNAVVVWRRTPGTGLPAIMQARRGAGNASFGTPTSLPNVSGSNNYDLPRLAVNRAGQAVVAWKDFTANENFMRVLVATSTTPFAGTTTDYNEGFAGSLGQPDVAINEAGDAAVVWVHPAGSNTLIDAAYRVHGAAFGTIQQLASDPNGKGDPSVAIDSQGNAVALWDESNNSVIRAYARPAGAGVPWSKLNDPDSGAGSATPRVAFDSGRTAVAAWALAGPLRTSTLAPGAGTQFGQPPQSLTDASEQPFDPSLEAGTQGTSLLAWGASAGVRAAARPNAGVFGPITTLTPAGHGGDSPDVAVDAQGNGAAVWIDSNPPDVNTRVVTAEYDATAPQFTAQQVPDGALLGEPMQFSATAVDDWSHPTIGWSFGDGGIAFGDAVGHTYTAPGTYTVTATAIDGGGNTASFTHTLIVPEPPPPPDLPTRGVDFNASTVSGTVLVSVPENAPAGRVLARPVVRGAAAIKPPSGYSPFRELGKDDNIPVGSILDASKGVSSITMATNAGGTVTQTGKFSKGVFKTKQRLKVALTTSVVMGGGNFKRDCRKARAGKSGVSAAARRRPSRRLFSNVKGRFRTRGRNSTATVRGTQYLVKDTCAGTRTTVRKGSVRVFDLVKRKGRNVKAGKSYLARPKSARKRHRG